MTCYFCIILLKANFKISLQEKSEGKTLTWRGCLVLASMSIATDEKRTDVETDEKNAEMATTRVNITKEPRAWLESLERKSQHICAT